jgi:colanic acid/amylovoran biosynthesis protein
MKVNRFLITGGQLHGNLGAAAMSIVTVERIRSLFPDAEILFVSKYIEGERRNVPRFFGSPDAVRLIPTSQVRATFFDLPLSITASLFRAQGVASRLNTVLKGFRESDVVVDIGGITFSEERGLGGLVINATWALLPVLAGKPIVKLSQAFGPIRRRWFRAVSRALLCRISVLIARGQLSAEELGKLGLRQKSWECADLAFLLPSEETDAVRRIEKPEGGIVIGVAPSSVLYQKFDGQPYIDLMVAVVDQLLREYADASVWVCAHAFREEDTLSNNDGPVCRKIYESLSADARSRTRLIMGNYTPAEMRVIVSKTDTFLACRFHAMVSALAVGVPVAVFGWSHKYREVQAQFDLDYCLDQKAASVGSICELMREVIMNRVTLKERILARLPRVVESSARNFDVLAAFVNGKYATPGGRR